LAAWRATHEGLHPEHDVGGETLSLVEATSQISEGFREAETDCRQISNCHQSVDNGARETVGFERLRVAEAIHRISEWTKELARLCTSLEVASQWGGATARTQ
jgi:hypothetical protein